MELWLDEALELDQGRALKVRVTRVLESVQTKYQKLDVVETQSFGRMMLLDGVIMFTTRDEFCYHEMIAHVPMLTHPRPESVLVVGGGDGGTVREVLKHQCVKNVVLCDIDEMVGEMSRKYFPEVASALNDPRIRIVTEDGAEYVKRNGSSFDVIIVDSTDPIGPGATLFQRPFYQSMKSALRPGGVITCQSESFQYHRETIGALFEFIPTLFRKYGYYWISIPTYPSGIIGFSILSDELDPYAPVPDETRVPGGLRYYTPQIHRASFVLPAFAKEFIPVDRQSSNR